MMHLGLGVGLLTMINFILFIAGIGILVLAVIVLLKLNKALNIWLAERNNRGEI